MPTPDVLWDELFKGLESLREKWPSRQWALDAALNCVVSSIPTSAGAAAETAIADVFRIVFTSALLPSAPEEVRTLANKCRGLRASQKLLWSGEPQLPGAFGLWWPWDDGATVSLRIGLHDVDLPKERYQRLRTIFGVA